MSPGRTKMILLWRRCSRLKRTAFRIPPPVPRSTGMAPGQSQGSRPGKTSLPRPGAFPAPALFASYFGPKAVRSPMGLMRVGRSHISLEAPCAPARSGAGLIPI